MINRLTSIIALVLVALAVSPARADEYSDAIAIFKNAGASGKFFNTAYGYAVFPSIVKAGIVVGGAHGDGRVYTKGMIVGVSSMTQGSIGLQIGAEGYREIIFFEDEHAFKQFSSGNFEFGADAQAVALKTSAQAGSAGSYNKGMATFTNSKGGLMLDVSIGGQKFSYKPL
jgi:lipid-binding SYLF domain-containing protein